MVKEAPEKFTVRRKGKTNKQVYHDLRDAFLGVLCHNTLHIPVAHHAPHITLLLLIPANGTPLDLAASAAGGQAVCKGSTGKTGMGHVLGRRTRPQTTCTHQPGTAQGKEFLLINSKNRKGGS